MSCRAARGSCASTPRGRRGRRKSSPRALRPTTSRRPSERRPCSCGGLLHNRAELVQLLGEDPGPNDATLIARAYEQWGEGAIERVQGSCAIVICDARQRIVLAARDRLGTYPLFHLADRERHVFSNSIDALLAQDGVSNALNLPALVDHLRHVWPFADETYFEAVHRVPPGNVLRRDANGSRLRRYWDPEPEGRFEWVQPDEIEQFDVLFEQAVARCQAPGRVGIFLSGGLDSVSVAAVATSRARATGEPDPLALSLAFPDPEANEEPVQRAVAAGLGLEQVMLDWGEAVGPRGPAARGHRAERAGACPAAQPLDAGVRPTCRRRA